MLSSFCPDVSNSLDYIKLPLLAIGNVWVSLTDVWESWWLETGSKFICAKKGYDKRKDAVITASKLSSEITIGEAGSYLTW